MAYIHTTQTLHRLDSTRLDLQRLCSRLTLRDLVCFLAMAAIQSVMKRISNPHGLMNRSSPTLGPCVGAGNGLAQA